MAIMILLVTLYVLVCLFLIMVVLLQQGKGADLAGAFGGAGSQTSFGPRTTTNIMHRLTTGSFVLFVVLSMTLAILSGRGRDSSAMDSVQHAAVPTPVPAEQGTTSMVPPAEEPALPAELPATSEAPSPQAQPTAAPQG